MQKWFGALDAQWQPVFAREVTAPMESEQVKLWQQYLAAVEAAIVKATGAGDLDVAVAWRNERDRVGNCGNLAATRNVVSVDSEAHRKTGVTRSAAADERLPVAAWFRRSRLLGGKSGHGRSAFAANRAEDF